MTLDELLRQNATWLEQTLRRPLFEKVDEKVIKIPEEQRERQMRQQRERIDDLTRRKEEAAASYDQAIALEKAVLESLEAQRPPGMPPAAENSRD
ncbi:MAG: hypothetical protein ACT4O2_10325 [Beijerinckiaceae bacterium]